MSSEVRPRRSQAERRAEATTRLLEATIACVIEVGYAATSVAVIEERAGVSRGRRIHYFERKEDLIVAAVDYLFEQRATELLSEGPVQTKHPGKRIDHAVSRIWEYWRGEFSTVVLELRTAARTDPALREVLQPHEDAIREVSFKVFRDLLGPQLTSHPDCSRVLMLVVQAMNGLAHGRPHDREYTDRLIGEWQGLMRKLLL